MTDSRHFLLYCLGAFTITVALCGSLLPITTDEAYYIAWSKHLSAGYFDHPAGVAFLSWVGTYFPEGVLDRLGAHIAGVSSVFLAWRTYRLIFPENQALVRSATLLYTFSLVVLLNGLLITPDSFMVLMWTWALHEAQIAISRDPRRWVTAGAIAGLGFHGKYIMVLIGPIFILQAWKAGHLKVKWPWLGLLLGLMVASPNMVWNAQNDWVSYKFQLKHGVSAERGEWQSTSQLPRATKPPTESVETDLALSFVSTKKAIEDLQASTTPKKKDRTEFEKFTQRVGDYIGSLAGIWGVIAIVILMSFFSNKGWTKIPQLPLFRLSVCIPVVFFGIFTVFGKVEANWASIYALAVPPLIAGFVRSRWVLVGAFFNVALLIILSTHGSSPWLKIRQDRVLKETAGFQDLANHLMSLEKVSIFADKYQLTSMLNFRGVPAWQWPGVTRDSEFTRNSKFQPHAVPQSEFVLVSTDLLPPRLPGFYPFDMQQIRVCREGFFIYHSETVRNAIEDCPKPIHTWQLIRYRPIATL